VAAMNDFETDIRKRRKKKLERERERRIKREEIQRDFEEGKKQT
jgi:hypothetical protein